MSSDLVRVLYYLLYRDIKVIIKNSFDVLINNLVFVAMQVVVLGRLFEVMGVPSNIIMSTTLGGILIVFPIVGYNKSLESILDVEYGKRINFELSLPISSTASTLRIVLSSVLYFFFHTFPIVIFSRIMLIGVIDFSQVNIGMFCLTYLVSAIFFAQFYLLMAFGLSYNFFRHHLWSRINGPLLFIGPVMYSYQNLVDTLPFIAKLVLINPLTYSLEAFRSAILGSVGPISFTTCILTLITLSLGLFPILKIAMKNRLDHV